MSGDGRPEHDPEARQIAAILDQAPRLGRLPLGPGDDAAVLPGGTTVAVDTLVESVHFDDALSPADVGFKALAVNVSDLAATGARPGWALVSVAVPAGQEAWVQGLARGLGEAARRWGVAIVGGDTTGSPGPRMVSITLGGPLVGPAPLRRDRGRPGDDLWVTGVLGLAHRGWTDPDAPEAARRALHRPEPPVDFALSVARLGLGRAAMDLSDGLARDLPRLAEASGVGAFVDPDAVPVDGLPAREAIRGGEDHQLLLAAAPRHREALVRLATAHGVRLSRIGTLTATPGLSLGGASWPRAVFDHFPADDDAG